MKLEDYVKSHKDIQIEICYLEQTMIIYASRYKWCKNNDMIVWIPECSEDNMVYEMKCRLDHKLYNSITIIS